MTMYGSSGALGQESMPLDSLGVLPPDAPEEGSSMLDAWLGGSDGMLDGAEGTDGALPEEGSDGMLPEEGSDGMLPEEGSDG